MKQATRQVARHALSSVLAYVRMLAVMAAILQDKNVKRGKLTFILTRGIGQAFIADDVAPDMVRGFLAEKLAG